MAINYDEKIAFPIYEKAVELDVPIEFHIGYTEFTRGRLKFAHVLDLDEVALAFPKLRILICHMGHYNYQDTVALMVKHENIFADVSWLVSLAALDRHSISSRHPVVECLYSQLFYPILYYFTQTRGASDKLLFGTDWPSTSPRRVVEIINGLNPMLKEHNLPLILWESIYNILERNWRKVFKLK